MDIFFAFTCYVNKNITLCGPRHAKMCRRVYADSEGPDQTVHQGLHCPLTESFDATESRAKARMILCALGR